MIRLKVKAAEYLHTELFDSFRTVAVHGGLLPLFQIEMPVCDKRFVLADIFYAKPFFNLNLGFRRFRTFVYL